MTEPVAPLIAATPVTVVSNANYNAGWTHQAGDLLILLWHSTAVPVPPAAGGTVPEWKPLTNTKLPQTLVSFSGSSMMLTVWYAWATRSGHTAGTWTNGSFGWMVALRNADKTNPFGSGSQRMDSVGGQTYPTAPGVGTLEFPGKSVVIHNFGWNHPSQQSYVTSPAASNGGLIQCTNTSAGVRGQYVGYQLNPTSAGSVQAQITPGANVTSGLSVEVVPLRPGPGINVLQAGTWKRSQPKAIMQDGVWTPTKRVSVLDAGTWKEVWPLTPVEVPQYMYDVTFEYLPNYEVQFHIKKGYVSADPNWEELIMLQSTIMGNPGPGGYCTRDPIFKFGDPGASYYRCTFEDRTGVPGDPTTQGVQIVRDVYPRA